jgi:hypothetical protein
MAIDAASTTPSVLESLFLNLVIPNVGTFQTLKTAAHGMTENNTFA